MIAWLELGDRRPDRFDDADALMTENASGRQLGTSPLRMCRSVPQIVVLVILTIASVGAVDLRFWPSSRAFFAGP